MVRAKKLREMHPTHKTRESSLFPFHLLIRATEGGSRGADGGGTWTGAGSATGRDMNRGRQVNRYTEYRGAARGRGARLATDAPMCGCTGA